MANKTILDVLHWKFNRRWKGALLQGAFRLLFERQGPHHSTGDAHSYFSYLTGCYSCEAPILGNGLIEAVSHY